MITIQNGLFSILLFIILISFHFNCNKTEKVIRINVGEYDMEGMFLSDSIPDGKINYYYPNTQEVIATKHFKNGILDGEAINYYNSKVIQVKNYNHGREFGFSEIYDSSENFLRFKYFYYYGRKIGPSYMLDQNQKLLFYDFTNFENEVLYSVEYDSETGQYYSDNIEALKNLTVDEVILNNQKKLKLFFYLINPPKSNVNYQICYMDQSDKIVDSILIPNDPNNFFWENHINYPLDGQKLGLIITKYDSIYNLSKTMITYISNYKDKINKQ